MNIERERYARGYIEVNIKNIVNNINSMKEHIQPETKIIAVVKTDGYGHGAIPIVKAIEHLECIYGFAVATEEEAIEIVKTGVSKPVIILGYTFPYAYKEMAEKGIETTVFREDMLEEMGRAANSVGKTMKVHIKVDTGMGRIGISPDEEGLEFVKKAINTKGIEVVGIFTHFAKADEEDVSSAREQLATYNQFVIRVERELGVKNLLKHCSNSAAILQMPEAGLDAVRAGIALYGLEPSNEVQKNGIMLRPALSFYSTIIFVKDMPKGSPISYGGTYITNKLTKVATVPVGYGDGYPRSLSNKGYVLIRGEKAPILGRVCMDQMMVDVTDIKDVKEGDRVTLIGKDGQLEISANFLGELSGRFNYELVCDLGKRIPRLHYFE